jgi:hypothetical protein
MVTLGELVEQALIAHGIGESISWLAASFEIHNRIIALPFDALREEAVATARRAKNTC